MSTHKLLSEKITDVVKALAELIPETDIDEIEAFFYPQSTTIDTFTRPFTDFLYDAKEHPHRKHLDGFFGFLHMVGRSVSDDERQRIVRDIAWEATKLDIYAQIYQVPSWFMGSAMKIFFSEVPKSFIVDHIEDVDFHQIVSDKEENSAELSNVTRAEVEAFLNEEEIVAEQEVIDSSDTANNDNITSKSPTLFKDDLTDEEIFQLIESGELPAKIFSHVGRWFAFRRNGHWTLKDVAKSLNCSDSIVSKFENNAQIRKDRASIIEMLSAYQLSMKDFEDAGYNLEDFPLKNESLDPHTVGGYIRSLRKEKGWTQPQLAEKLADLGWKITFHDISNIELGQYDMSSRRILLEAIILGIFDKGEADLFNATGKAFSDFKSKMEVLNV